MEYTPAESKLYEENDDDFSPNKIIDVPHSSNDKKIERIFIPSGEYKPGEIPRGREINAIYVDEAGVLFDTLIAFYGFTGILGLKFSVITKMMKSDVMAMFSFSDTALTIYKLSDFGEMVNNLIPMLKEGEQLEEIDLMDALSILKAEQRGDYEKEKEQEVTEVDGETEFDESCNIDCLPGYHTCGK